jgi:hypothetical protein
VALGCALMLGCGAGTGGGSAGDVVKKYITAVSKGDTAAALTCVAPEKRAGAEPIIQLGSQVAMAFIKSEGGLDSVTIVNEEVQGDRARIGYKTRTRKGMERMDSVSAERINGTWYVAQ